MTLFGFRLPAMSSLLIWAALWEVVGQMKLSFFIPPISIVIVTLFKLLPTPAFLNALGSTASAFAAGVFFAIVIGIPVGILMGEKPPGRRAVSALGEHFSVGTPHRACAGADGAFRFWHQDHHHHDVAVRDLDHHPECPRRRAPDQPVAHRDGAQFRRDAG
jgi:hypothetical protein